MVVPLRLWLGHLSSLSPVMEIKRHDATYVILSDCPKLSDCVFPVRILMRLNLTFWQHQAACPSGNKKSRMLLITECMTQLIAQRNSIWMCGMQESKIMKGGGRGCYDNGDSALVKYKAGENINNT